MTFEHGPYGGYLQQVTRDYFLDAGLRQTHTAVDGLPLTLRDQVAPWFPDLVPWPPLLAELPAATLGAWGNYLGDIYNGGAVDNSPEGVDRRREVAVASTLTMGLLRVVDSALVRPNPDADTTVGFMDKLGLSLQRGTGKSYELPKGAGRVAVDLAEYMHGRLGLANPLRGGAIADDLRLMSTAFERQDRLEHTDISGLIGAAGDLGEAAASWVLRYTEFRDADNPGDNIDGRITAQGLGRLGGYLRHGTNIEAAVRTRRPTYATAILLRRGGATTAALRGVAELRENLAQEAITMGAERLEPGNRRQQGIFRMAVRLLRIREVGMRRPSPRRIDNLLNSDPFWAAST